MFLNVALLVSGFVYNSYEFWYDLVLSAILVFLCKNKVMFFFLTGRTIRAGRTTCVRKADLYHGKIIRNLEI